LPRLLEFEIEFIFTREAGEAGEVWTQEWTATGSLCLLFRIGQCRGPASRPHWTPETQTTTTRLFVNAGIPLRLQGKLPTAEVIAGAYAATVAFGSEFIAVRPGVESTATGGRAVHLRRVRVTRPTNVAFDSGVSFLLAVFAQETGPIASWKLAPRLLSGASRVSILTFACSFVATVAGLIFCRPQHVAANLLKSQTGIQFATIPECTWTAICLFRPTRLAPRRSLGASRHAFAGN